MAWRERVHGCGLLHPFVQPLAETIASVAIVIVVVVSVATARLNDAAGEHPTSEQQPDHSATILMRIGFYPPYRCW